MSKPPVIQETFVTGTQRTTKRLSFWVLIKLFFALILGVASAGIISIFPLTTALISNNPVVVQLQVDGKSQYTHSFPGSALKVESAEYGGAQLKVTCNLRTEPSGENEKKIQNLLRFLSPLFALSSKIETTFAVADETTANSGLIRLKLNWPFPISKILALGLIIVQFICVRWLCKQNRYAHLASCVTVGLWGAIYSVIFFAGDILPKLVVSVAIDKTQQGLSLSTWDTDGLGSALFSLACAWTSATLISRWLFRSKQENLS